MKDARGWVISKRITGRLQTGFIFRKEGEGPLVIPYVEPVFPGEPTINVGKLYNYNVDDFNWFLTLPDPMEGTKNHGNNLSVHPDLDEDVKIQLSKLGNFESLQVLENDGVFTVHTDEIVEGETQYHALQASPLDKKPKKVAVDLD